MGSTIGARNYGSAHSVLVSFLGQDVVLTYVPNIYFLARYGLMACTSALTLLDPSIMYEHHDLDFGSAHSRRRYLPIHTIMMCS